MLLAVSAAKPRSRAMTSRSKGNPLPASAPEPSGMTLTRRRASEKRSALRAAHMRVARNDCPGIARREVDQRSHHAGQQRPHAITFAAQPQAQVERNLFVAAAAGVDLIRHRAGMLLQL